MRTKSKYEKKQYLQGFEGILGCIYRPRITGTWSGAFVCGPLFRASLRFARFRKRSTLPAAELVLENCYRLRNQKYLSNWVIKAGIPPCGSSSRAKPLSRCSTRQWLSRHKKTALAGTRRGYFIPRSIDFGRKRQLLQYLESNRTNTKS